MNKLETHEFKAYPAGKFPNSCVRCGKHKDAPVHKTK